MIDEIQLSRDAWGRLVFEDDRGVRHVDVYPVRAFPLSNPNGGVALCDREGTELAWVADFAALSPEVKQRIEAALAEREFTPRILAILRVHSSTEPSAWDVRTDRGDTTFIVRQDEDVRRLDNHRALVVDSHGVRYLIEDTRAMDAGSRRLLERYL